MKKTKVLTKIRPTLNRRAVVVDLKTKVLYKDQSHTRVVDLFFWRFNGRGSVTAQLASETSGREVLGKLSQLQ